EGKTDKARLVPLKKLMDRMVPIPVEWIQGNNLVQGDKTTSGLALQPLKCESWEELLNSCRKALDWTEGLDRAMSLIYASIISVKSNGEPLWLKLVSPPSTAKTTLAEAVAVATKYVHAQSTLTGFHSGWKSDKHGTEDHGLVPKINGKTFIVKDADT